MTENEAKNKLDSLHDKILNTSFCKKVYESEVEALCMAKDVLEEIQQYRSIGAIDEFKALKDKSEPKKPIIHGLGQRYCPVCKCGGADHFYCARCGQKLG